MATNADVRKIALALPGTCESEIWFAFSVPSKGKQRGYAWAWKERIELNKPKVPNLGVLVVRVTGEDEKQMLLASSPDVYFTEDHYNNYPAVLVRLANIEHDELAEILEDAWKTVAPSSLLTTKVF